MKSFITAQDPSPTEASKEIISITNKFNFEQLLNMLSSEKLTNLCEDFNRYNEGATRGQFIEMLKKYVDYDMEEEFDVIHGLSKFFEEVDVNNKSIVTWADFSQYIIDIISKNRVKKKERRNDE